MKQSTRITCRSLALLVAQLLGDWKSLFVFTPGMLIQNKPGEIYKVIFKEVELHYEDLQIRYHRAIFILYRSVIALIAHFTMSSQMLMPAIGTCHVGLDQCNSGRHLACRLPGDDNTEVCLQIKKQAVAVVQWRGNYCPSLSGKVKITLLAYFSSVHKLDMPSTKLTVLQTCSSVFSCVHLSILELSALY